MRKILVTGGAGFIGRVVAADLRYAGNRVDILDLPKALLEPNLETYFDVAIPYSGTSCLRSLPEYDVVVHCGAVCDTRNGDPVELIDTNYELTRDLYHHVRTSLFIYFSSAGVYGDAEAWPNLSSSGMIPKTRYAMSKLLCERFLSTMPSRKTVIVRPFNVYGPGEHTKAEHTRSIVYRLCEAFTRESPTEDEKMPWWNATRDFVFVDDVSEQIGRLIKNATTVPYQVPTALNFGSGVPTSVSDIVECLEKMTGVRAQDVLNYRLKSMYSADSYQEHTLAMEPYCANMTTMYDGIEMTLRAIRKRRGK